MLWKLTFFTSKNVLFHCKTSNDWDEYLNNIVGLLRGHPGLTFPPPVPPYGRVGFPNGLVGGEHLSYLSYLSARNQRHLSPPAAAAAAASMFSGVKPAMPFPESLRAQFASRQQNILSPEENIKPETDDHGALNLCVEPTTPAGHQSETP